MRERGAKNSREGEGERARPGRLPRLFSASPSGRPHLGSRGRTGPGREGPRDPQKHACVRLPCRLSAPPWRTGPREPALASGSGVPARSVRDAPRAWVGAVPRRGRQAALPGTQALPPNPITLLIYVEFPTAAQDVAVSAGFPVPASPRF